MPLLMPRRHTSGTFLTVSFHSSHKYPISTPTLTQPYFVICIVELRTPLSAANSGLQMLHAELSETASCTNPIDTERLDTLTDVCSAINTTVSILDDLLTFEKMESGKN